MTTKKQGAGTQYVKLGIKLAAVILKGRNHKKDAAALRRAFRLSKRQDFSDLENKAQELMEISTVDQNRVKVLKAVAAVMFLKSNSPTDPEYDKLLLKQEAFNFLVYAGRKGFKIPLDMHTEQRKFTQEFKEWKKRQGDDQAA